MIKGLMGQDGIFVDSGNTALPYHTPQQGDSFSGVIRLNGSDLQYYSSGVWVTLPTSYATVKMDASIVSWVRQKQTEERKHKDELEAMQRRAKEHPSLAKAYEAIERAERELNAGIDRAVENFKVLDKIIGEETWDGEAGRAVSMPMQSP